MQSPSLTQVSIVPLNEGHSVNAFDCGVEGLNQYLKTRALQDARRRVAAPFVLLATEVDTVMGYYTLSSFSVVAQSLPDSVTRRLPRYLQLPAVLLGRLAVDKPFQGQQWGQLLLIDALRQAFHNSIAATFMVVDTVDEQASRFYQKFGFIPFQDHPQRLFLPLKTVETLISR
jgi:GNAT superfamily N-acetyltransferase